MFYRENLRDGVGRFLGDLFFTCDVAEFAKIFAGEESNSVYMYFFKMRSSANPWPEWMGVMHGYEIEYMFGRPLYLPSLYKKELRETEQAFSKYILDLWAQFIKSGRPSDTWIPYVDSGYKAFVLNEDSVAGAEEYVDLNENQCTLIREAKPVAADQQSTVTE
ncbi:hypothetical protein DICVIV_14203 [Dictyocaulus viviparus]|uniref:Carboxylesterase type B domain-containing protein n=1 Tax=Dictyocaulus viviparus TaxID=29172 RepID=A0A0D8X5T9_DICVI|nr:hypothetical protein DICVIV_14203 [Dictyocaulus viviparus]